MGTKVSQLRTSTSPSAWGTGVVREYVARIDFSVESAIQGDIVQCISLPANCIVLTAWIVPIVAEGATSTVDLGITGVTDDRWLDTADLNATAGTAIWGTGTVTTGIMGSAYHVTTADTIDLVMNTSHTTNTAVVDVHALVLDLTRTMAGG
jgi:hypothetical protein